MCLLSTFSKTSSLKLLGQFKLCPPPKVRVGGHIGLSADPVGIGVRVGVGVTNTCTQDIS